MAGPVDVGSFLSALVGAVAALGGVLITQSSARRNAHADRTWSARTTAYGALYKMLQDDLRILMRDDVDSLPKGSRDVLRRPLPHEFDLYLFGSKSVVASYREYYKAVVDVLSASDTGELMLATMRVATDKAVKLQQVIIRETRGD